MGKQWVHLRDLFEDLPDGSATTVSETKEKADQETRGVGATSVREQLAGQQDGRDPANPTHRANSASRDNGELPDTSAIPNSKVGIGDASAIDESFVTNLDARMAKSDLKELGWRDGLLEKPKTKSVLDIQLDPSIPLR